MRKPVEIGWGAKAIAAYPSKEQFIKDHEAAYPDVDLAAVWDKYNPDVSKDVKKK